MKGTVSSVWGSPSWSTSSRMEGGRHARVDQLPSVHLQVKTRLYTINGHCTCCHHIHWTGPTHIDTISQGYVGLALLVLWGLHLQSPHLHSPVCTRPWLSVFSGGYHHHTRDSGTMKHSAISLIIQNDTYILFCYLEWKWSDDGKQEFFTSALTTNYLQLTLVC